jgi:hypothetical protein
MLAIFLKFWSNFGYWKSHTEHDSSAFKQINTALGHHIRVNGGGAAGYQHIYPLSGSCQFQCEFQLIVWHWKWGGILIWDPWQRQFQHSSVKCHIWWHKKNYAPPNPRSMAVLWFWLITNSSRYLKKIIGIKEPPVSDMKKVPNEKNCWFQLFLKK